MSVNEGEMHSRFKEDILLEAIVTLAIMDGAIHIGRVLI